MRSDVVSHAEVTSGTWTKCSSRSTASGIICGEWSTRRAKCWISWSRADVSYGAARKEILPGVEHRQHRYLNNRAEVSHQPTRQQERQMRGFKSPRQAQRFLSAHGPIASLFRPRRHRMKANAYIASFATRPSKPGSR